ncbi:uncharacterized protein LOC115733547 [Rhodamnia argentea]|uniref:Uncharacterized protein LOC115733547 n=1 Tax=Rhodamnia argentea TaxID=178133 RepID=A0A8B8NDH2_9MYRT|nr:uncharacterized protein LOC115733547 [Rhodamnia argentea]
MDREQEERRSLGFFGVVKESIKIIFTWRKIFSQITPAFILPLGLIFLAHMEISAILLAKIHHDGRPLGHSEADTPRYNKLSDFATSNTIELLLFTVIAFVLVGAFSLLSTSAVVCTTTCVYTSKSIAFGGVMRVLPKVWKRLLITNLWSFLAFSVYIVVATAIFYLFALIPSPATVLGPSFHLPHLIPLRAGVYQRHFGLGRCDFSGRGHLWDPGHVQEQKPDQGETGGFASHQPLVIDFVHGNPKSVLRLCGPRTWIGVPKVWGCNSLFLFLLNLLLFAPVVQTVIYFVCKSYHHENIDKSPLVDHLEVHLLADYLPPKADDV